VIGGLTAGSAESNITFTAQELEIDGNVTVKGSPEFDGNVTVNRDIILGAGTIQYKQKVLAISTQNGSAYEIVGLGEYVDQYKYGHGVFEQTEIGSEHQPLCLHYTMISTNGCIVDKHIPVNYRDMILGVTAYLVYYISDLNALAAQLSRYLPLNGGTLTTSYSTSINLATRLGQNNDGVLQIIRDTYESPFSRISSTDELRLASPIIKMTGDSTIDGSLVIKAGYYHSAIITVDETGLNLNSQPPLNLSSSWINIPSISSTLSLKYCVDSANPSYFDGGSFSSHNYIAIVGAIATGVIRNLHPLMKVQIQSFTKPTS
jgi:hypothetical protein